jgi:hypothetical protein
MRGSRMQSMGRTGTTRTPSLGRTGSLFGRGIGYGGIASQLGAGLYGSRGLQQGQYGGASQGGGGGGAPQGSGGGGYGANSSQLTSQPYGVGGYDASNPGTGPSPAKSERDPFAAVRGQAGRLAWPVALRYLTRDGLWKETRERIDSQVDQLAATTARKSLSADLLSGLRDDVAKVRQYFYRQSYDLPMTRQQEADARRFLNKVRDALEHFPDRAKVAAY